MLRAVIKFSNQFKTCSGQHEGFRSYLFFFFFCYEKGTKCKIRCHGVLIAGRIVSSYPHPLLGGWAKCYTVAACKVQSISRVLKSYPTYPFSKFWNIDRNQERLNLFRRFDESDNIFEKKTMNILDVGDMLCVIASIKTCYLPCLIFLESVFS